MIETQRHFQLAVALTLLSIVTTEVIGHAFGGNETLSAGLFLLGLVPIAYAGLRAGFLAGTVCTFLLAMYTLHYVGPHGMLLENSAEAWSGFGVIALLGLAMSWPMSVIRQRELRLRAAIEHRTMDLQARNAELTELNAALEAFGYVVSHDLKEPVRAIENYLHAAREDFPAGESKRYVDEAYQANGRLASMLQGLLEYSRASSAPTAPATLDIEDVIRGEPCRTQYGRYFDEHHVDLDIERGIPKVLGDRLLLAQLFGNLLLNAARHNPNDKRIVHIARLPAPAGRVHLTIADNGHGFPPEVIARFSEIPSNGIATVKGGFGLVIAQRSARRLSGRLWLENASTGGAIAHVELPAA